MKKEKDLVEETNPYPSKSPHGLRKIKTQG